MHEQQQEKGIVQYSSDFAGVSAEFMRRYKRILLSKDSGEAMARAIDAMWEGVPCHTISVTVRNEDGTFSIVDNYKDGQKWDHRIGEVVPEWGIAPATAKAGRAVFRITDEEDVKKPLWFLYPYFLSVPVRSSLTGDEVVGTFALGMFDASRFNEESAVIAGLVASAYQAVCDSMARLDHGIEIGRAIEQERMVQRLHDTSVQEIFACECALELLLRENAQDKVLTGKLSEVLALLHSANRNLRQVLAEARLPRATGPVLIEEVVNRTIEAHREQGGCPVAVLVERGLLVPSRAATVAESVLAEALTNVRKHSRASMAAVSCSILGKLLAISVTDDGIGMSVDALAETCEAETPKGLHFGISNLKRMVEKTGGAFAVVSCEEGRGTIVRARIPLTQDLVAAGTIG